MKEAYKGNGAPKKETISNALAYVCHPGKTYVDVSDRTWFELQGDYATQAFYKDVSEAGRQSYRAIAVQHPREEVLILATNEVKDDRRARVLDEDFREVGQIEF